MNTAPHIVQQLLTVVAALDELQVPYLVMGGHAVRYYGFNRETSDHDLAIPMQVGERLADLLAQTSLFVEGVPAETVTWRGKDFRRFVLGTLPNGKEELLEFWVRNHLLDDFEALYQRREVGSYGGSQVCFLALPDLIRSKETERDHDWDDIRYLEEILDQRQHALALQRGDFIPALTDLRSASGFESAVQAGWCNDAPAVAAALANASYAVSVAFLLPYDPFAQLSVANKPTLSPS